MLIDSQVPTFKADMETSLVFVLATHFLSSPPIQEYNMPK